MKRAIAIMALSAGVVCLSSGAAVAGTRVNYNDSAYWSAVTGYECTKVEYPSGSRVTSTALDGSFPLVVVKGGSVDWGLGRGIATYGAVTAGDVVAPPLNAGGQQAAISWLMTCTGENDGGGGSAS
jgi:hypothetical protein